MTDIQTLRSKALKGKAKKRASFEYDGEKYELVAPTVGEYVKMTNKSKDLVDTSVWALIFLTVLPGTNNKVFEDTDYDAFMGQTLDGFMAASKEALIEVLSGVNEDVKKDIETSS